MRICIRGNPMPMRTFLYKGQIVTINDICKMNGLTRRANELRIKKGRMTIEEICETKSLVKKGQDRSGCTYPDCFHCRYADCIKE